MKGKRLALGTLASALGLNDVVTLTGRVSGRRIVGGRAELQAYARGCWTGVPGRLRLGLVVTTGRRPEGELPQLVRVLPEHAGMREV